MAGDIQYPAFLSYSHRDRQVADWLHRELETFSIPRHMAPRPGRSQLPARLAPIFKDREELSACGSLSSAINDALHRSSALIVICSPAAAASPWVNEEIRSFKRMKGSDRLFALIAAGDPWASLDPGREAEECFPPALRFMLGADGAITAERAEPIAADIRPGGDGKRLAKLKIIAGLLDVGLDELVQRDAQRRTRRLRYLAAASVAGMAVTSGLAIAAVDARDEARDQRNEAQHQRAQADGLIEFMLTDLRGKLEPVGRLDVLDSVGQRALSYYAGQDLATLDPDALGRRARALHLVAEVGDLRGNSDAARQGFREAARSTGELLKRDPGNWQRVYDHAQSEFWLAYDAHNRDDPKTALRHFMAYRELAQRLMQLAPGKSESQLELASAEINLGTALVRDRRLEPAIASFDRAATGLRAMPRTRDVALNLNQALGHKASALYALGDNQAALDNRRQQLAVLDSPPLDSKDREVQEAKAIVLAQSGIAYLASGSRAASENLLDQAISQWNELIALDPANTLWIGEHNASWMWRAVVRSAGAPSRARQELEAVTASQRRLVARSPDWVHKINLLRMISFERAMGAAPDPADERLIREVWARRDTLKSDERAVLAAVLISEGDRAALEDRQRAAAVWQAASGLLSGSPEATWVKVQRARLALRLGEPQRPRPVVSATAFAGIFAKDAT